MKNAFNAISRQAVAEECATFSPKFCLGCLGFMGHTYPLLWRPLVQSQGFNRGIALVLHKLISSVDANDECIDLLYQAWYLDDDALAGNHSAVLRAMDIIEKMGPALGLHIIEEMGPALGLHIIEEMGPALGLHIIEEMGPALGLHIIEEMGPALGLHIIEEMGPALGLHIIEEIGPALGLHIIEEMGPALGLHII